MSIIFTTIRIIIALVFIAYGIFNIIMTIGGCGDIISCVNMVVAPILLIATKYLLPAFYNSINSELLFSLVLGLFVGGGILTVMLGIGFISGFLHGVGWIAVAFIVLNLSETAAPVASFLSSIVSLLFTPIAFFIFAGIFIIAFFCFFS